MRKNILFGLLLSIVSLNLWADEITGVGELKINMSVQDFLNLPEIKDKDLRDTSVYAKVPGDFYMWKKTAEDSNIDGHSRIFSKDIVKYEFMMSIGVPNILGKDRYKTTAVFYKENLVEIVISDKLLDIKEILTQKYGKPVVQNWLKRITCQNGFGAVTNQLNGDIFYEWGKGKKITATLMNSISDCGKDMIGIYTVENSAVSKMIYESEAKSRKAFEAESRSNKASASKL